MIKLGLKFLAQNQHFSVSSFFYTTFIRTWIGPFWPPCHPTLPPILISSYMLFVNKESKKDASSLDFGCFRNFSSYKVTLGFWPILGHFDQLWSGGLPLEPLIGCQWGFFPLLLPLIYGFEPFFIHLNVMIYIQEYISQDLSKKPLKKDGYARCRALKGNFGAMDPILGPGQNPLKLFHT